VDLKNRVEERRRKPCSSTVVSPSSRLVTQRDRSAKVRFANGPHWILQMRS